MSMSLAPAPIHGVVQLTTVHPSFLPSYYPDKRTSSRADAADAADDEYPSHLICHRASAIFGGGSAYSCPTYIPCVRRTAMANRRREGRYGPPKVDPDR